jgi:hypothetical protein
MKIVCKELHLEENVSNKIHQIRNKERVLTRNEINDISKSSQIMTFAIHI